MPDNKNRRPQFFNTGVFNDKAGDVAPSLYGRHQTPAGKADDGKGKAPDARGKADSKADDARARAAHAPLNDVTIATFGGMPEGVQVKSLMPGDVVGGTYQITKMLGQGGMGTVYACKHQLMTRQYAIKVLNGGQPDAETWTRFQSEARALAKLNHPGIVSVYNMGIDGLTPYYVMDLLSGDNLEHRIRRDGCLPFELAIDLFIQVADALGFAHNCGIVHRDVKPSNLMLERDSHGGLKVKLVDFGIARLTQNTYSNQSQTATGLIFGTPYYMSPEQCEGKKVDGRSDIYSLGCSFFEALTGVPPFCGESAFETFMMHQTEPAPRLSEMAQTSAGGIGSFPQALELSMQKMLAKAAGDRYQTMEQLKHDLERIRDGKPIQIRKQNKTEEAVELKHEEPESTGKPDNRQVLYLKVGLAVSLAMVLALGSWILCTQKPLTADKSAIAAASRTQSSNEFTGKMIDAANVRIGGNGMKLGPAMQQDFQEAIVNPDVLKRFGATDKELASARDYDYFKISDLERTYNEKIRPYIRKNRWKRSNFGQEASVVGFSFPTDVSAGLIKIDGGELQQATDIIPCSVNSKAVFYMHHGARKLDRMLDNFDENDLTGVEMVSLNPVNAIKILKNWKRLEEVSFFNSTQKCMPSHESYEDSGLTDEDLPLIEDLKNLKSLGLCGRHLTAQKVLEMPVLKRVTTLKLKSIPDGSAIVDQLKNYDNIKELWLCSMETSEKDLRRLAHMKNLETLRIRRSSKIKPSSLEYFKDLPRLKHLVLDHNNWSEADKALYRKELPDCKFEPVVDIRYWDLGLK